MAEPTLQEVFGANAVQNDEWLVISKSDLAQVGLVPAISNTPESLYLAILLLGKRSLTVGDLLNNLDQSIGIEDPTFTLVTRNSKTYKQDLYVVTLQKEDTKPNIDPDDY